jgi:hypothetical protein
MKYFELAPFEVRLTADTIAAALAASAAGGDGHTTDTDTKASDR